LKRGLFEPDRGQSFKSLAGWPRSVTPIESESGELSEQKKSLAEPAFHFFAISLTILVIFFSIFSIRTVRRKIK